MGIGGRLCSATRHAHSARADERYRDSLPHIPTGDAFALCGNNTRQLVARHVRQSNVGIVPHPSVPIAAAKSGGFHLNDHAVVRRNWVSYTLNAERFPELFVNCSFHLLIVQWRDTLR